MLNVITFESGKPGPRLAMTGAVHGNEICGTQALQRLAEELQRGDIRLEAGRLLLIPIANPEAYKQNRRFVEANLNRVFRRHEAPTAYEHHVANDLCAALADSNVLIDFHSIHSRGEPFVLRFNEVSPREEALLLALGVPAMVEGWAEAYQRSLPGIDMGQDMHSHAYMRSLGGIAAGVECGQHDDPAAVTVAYEAARRALVHLGMVAGTAAPAAPPKRLLVEEVVFSPTGQERFSRNFIHGEALAAGELIGTLADGTPARAPRDCLILFPRAGCPKGEEWYYLGRAAA